MGLACSISGSKETLWLHHTRQDPVLQTNLIPTPLSCRCAKLNFRPTCLATTCLLATRFTGARFVAECSS